KLVHQVRVRAAVPGTLNEGQMLSILNGRRERPDRLWQQVGVVRHLHARWDLVLRLLRRVQDVLLAFNERPLEALLRAIDVKAFAVLSSRVVQETPDVAGDVGVLDLDVAGLDGEWVPRFLLQLLANRAGTKARNVFRPAVDQPQARTDDVRGVVHG